MQISGKKATASKLTEVTVLIKYQPSADEPHPRMADLRIRSNKAAIVVSAEAGAALTNAKKNLYVDDLTGNPWRVRPDGSVQLLAYGAANSKTIDAGELAKIVYRVDSAEALSFWFVRRSQAFAPLGADQVLQASTYDNPAVVNP